MWLPMTFPRRVFLPLLGLLLLTACNGQQEPAPGASQAVIIVKDISDKPDMFFPQVEVTVVG